MRLPVWARRITSLPLRPIPRRIRGGPNAGRFWSLPVSGRGVVTGGYEATRFSTLAEVIQPDDTVWDVGAHYGYASLIAAGRLNEHGRLICIEPSSLNRQYLKRHLAWNGVVPTQVIPCAVAERDRSDTFGGRGGSVSFHLGHSGEVVAVRSVDSLVAEGTPRPTFLKVDVEGAEADVLEGGRGTLGPAGDVERPVVFLSVHSARLLDRCLEVLRSFQYDVLASTAVVDYLDGRAPWAGDPDLLAVPSTRADELTAFERTPAFRGGRPL